MSNKSGAGIRVGNAKLIRTAKSPVSLCFLPPVIYGVRSILKLPLIPGMFLGLLLIALPSYPCADTQKINMKIIISSSGETVLNKVNLDRIKRHILAAGTLCTYSNMYNNNPCWELAEFQLYLNPDPGSNGNPQWNINCDITVGDFNTLVIKKKDTAEEYGVIEFKQEHAIALSSANATMPSDIDRIKDKLEAAVLAALKTIKTVNEFANH